MAIRLNHFCCSDDLWWWTSQLYICMFSKLSYNASWLQIKAQYDFIKNLTQLCHLQGGSSIQYMELNTSVQNFKGTAQNLDFIFNVSHGKQKGRLMRASSLTFLCNTVVMIPAKRPQQKESKRCFIFVYFCRLKWLVGKAVCECFFSGWNLAQSKGHKRV